MIHFLLLQKLARVPLKNRFRLAIIIPGQCKYILLNKNVRTCNYLQRACKYIPQGRFPCSSPWSPIYTSRWFPLVILVYPWLSLFILGYLCLSLVILGFPWLSLVIRGYPWLSLVIYDSNICEMRICNYFSRHLQKSSAVAAR